MIRDTWRAILVLTTGVLLLEAASLRRQPPAPAPTVATNWQPQPAWMPAQPQPMQVWSPPPTMATERPIRRVARSLVELADSVLEVIR